MIRWILTLSALAAVLIGTVFPVAAQTTETAEVTVAQSDKHGAYLANAAGRALYLFTADQQGHGQTKAVSTCDDACAAVWPPLLTKDKPKAGKQVQNSLLGTVPRKDGATQVTYNGWPLYYFSRDQGPGETQGQDIHGFGGEWYLVTPKGTKVKGE
jgi:predicted lipoprotein with Yx(FWY)xxD motif